MLLSHLRGRLEDSNQCIWLLNAYSELGHEIITNLLGTYLCTVDLLHPKVVLTRKNKSFWVTYVHLLTRVGYNKV